MRVRIALAGLLALAAVACGGDDNPVACAGSEDVLDDVIDGSTMKVKLIEMPTPVDPEMNLSFAVQVLDSANSPLDGVTVEAEPWQPIHGHGVPITAVTTPRGSNGEYDIADIHFLHPGRWELRFNLTNGSDSETVTAFICVAGEPPPP